MDILQIIFTHTDKWHCHWSTAIVGLLGKAYIKSAWARLIFEETMCDKCSQI